METLGINAVYHRGAAILIRDGRGEAVNTTYSVGRQGSIEQLADVRMPHSLGMLYEVVTEHRDCDVVSAFGPKSAGERARHAQTFGEGSPGEAWLHLASQSDTQSPADARAQDEASSR